MNDYEKMYLELKKAVTELLKDLPTLSCEDFNHRKGEFHKDNDCPVQKRFSNSISKLIELGVWYD